MVALADEPELEVLDLMTLPFDPASGFITEIGDDRDPIARLLSKHWK
jgi:hypothetical protein